jgi:TetR/AcrR family transcriptional regulator, regulator of biofilm formation and stress response
VSTGANAAPQPTRRGRPSTGARERILDACLDVLKEEGYAGLSIAKVAARAGENKALISYHFGSKQGLIAAAGRELGESISEEILGGLTDAASTEEVVRGAADGLWALMERDERLARVYFDLNAVSVVEDDVRDVMREIKAGWRQVLTDLLGRGKDETAAVLVVSGLEGLSLERIERGDTAELRRAREMFIAATVAVIDG